MSEVRVRARVITPGAPGFLRVELVGDPPAGGTTVVDVRASTLSPTLRIPNAEFVAVVRGRDVLRVETAGAAWLEIQDRIRAVFNASWDPIGVAGVVQNEYDSYIAPVHALVCAEASAEQIASLLASFETNAMGLSRSNPRRLDGVVAELRRLRLPDVPR